MMLVKNSDEYIAYIEYEVNSGSFSVLQVFVVPKNRSDLDCKKIAEKILKSYQKDVTVLQDDIREFGSRLQKIQLTGG